MYVCVRACVCVSVCDCSACVCLYAFSLIRSLIAWPVPNAVLVNKLKVLSSPRKPLYLPAVAVLAVPTVSVVPELIGDAAANQQGIRYLHSDVGKCVIGDDVKLGTWGVTCSISKT